MQNARQRKFPHRRRPCDECPFRKDVPPGKFTAERFRKLAPTAYDMAMMMFACHKSAEGGEMACAGFLLRGATHNLSVRLAAAGNRGFDWRLVEDGGSELYENYRAMAIANGVSPEDPVLRQCR